MITHLDSEGWTVCEHGTALDVHCCNCHSGFIFDKDHICPVAEDDLPTRLRTCAENTRWGGDLMREAANEIERLRGKA